eukprot:3807463-Pyramimonas_sp.AAC.1
MVDAKGYMVDVKGFMVDAKGYMVDVKGFMVDAKGYMVDVNMVDSMRSGAIIRFQSVEQAASAVIGIIKCNLSSLARCELLNADGIQATNEIFKTSLE